MILNVENQQSLHYYIRDHIIIIVLVLFSAKLSVLQGYPFSSHNLCNPATHFGNCLCQGLIHIFVNNQTVNILGFEAKGLCGKYSTLSL